MSGPVLACLRWPARYLEAAAATLAGHQPPLDIRIVDGDHHLPIRHAPLVHTILEETRQ